MVAPVTLEGWLACRLRRAACCLLFRSFLFGSCSRAVFRAFRDGFCSRAFFRAFLMGFNSRAFFRANGLARAGARALARSETCACAATQGPHSFAPAPSPTCA